MGTSAIVQDGQRRAAPTMPGNMMAPPSPFLGVIPEWMWELPKRLWTLPFSATPVAGIAAGGNTTVSALVDINLYFVGYYGSATVRATAAGKAIQTGFPLTVALQTANNEVFQPAGQVNDINNLFGTAAQPSVWALPMILKPGDTLNAVITNNHNATAVDVALMLMGFLVKRK